MISSKPGNYRLRKRETEPAPLAIRDSRQRKGGRPGKKNYEYGQIKAPRGNLAGRARAVL